MIDWFLKNKEWIFSGVGVPIIRKLLIFFRRKQKSISKKKLIEHDNSWIPELNNLFMYQSKIIRLLDSEPKFIDDGTLKLSNEVKTIADDNRKRLKSEGFPIDTFAIIDREPLWNDDPISPHYKRTDFAEISALRSRGEKPKIISACAVLSCPGCRELYLHRRSVKSATFGGGLHTFGGAYIPLGKLRSDGQKLIKTIKREILEESGLSINISSNIPIMLSEELETGFIQFTWLGATINLRDKRNIETNWEGQIVIVPFDKLEQKILSNNEKWVPTGLAQVLSWLALGAPGCGPKERFGKFKAKELFSNILNILKKVKIPKNSE